MNEAHGRDAREPEYNAATLRERLAALAREYEILDIYAFGSRAVEIADRVHASAGSVDVRTEADLDVAVRPGNGVCFDVDRRVGFAQALEELLDVDRVDLVVLPEAGAFLALAAVSGELLCCEDPTDQAEYELYVLRRAGDLLPFERERRRLILEQGAR